MKSIKVLVFASALASTLLASWVLASAASGVTLFFPPEWKNDAQKAKAITDALSQSSGLEIKPRIAASYPEIVEIFSRSEPVMAYAGSFVQAVLYSRGLSVPLLQAVTGKEFYTSVLIAPKSAGSDALTIVKDAGPDVAYAKGASSGESGAKAATDGAAAVGSNNHGASVNAVKAGKAKCAFVKNWWWEANKGSFEDMQQLDCPGISDHKNPDNVLSANKSVSAEDAAKIKEAALGNAAAFEAGSFVEFDAATLGPSLDLMKKGKIDPKTYSW